MKKYRKKSSWNVIKVILIVLFVLAIVSFLISIIIGLNNPPIGAENIDLSVTEVIF